VFSKRTFFRIKKNFRKPVAPPIVKWYQFLLGSKSLSCKQSNFMLVISGLLAELWPSLRKFQQMTITHHFQCKFSLGFQRFWTFFYPKVFTTCHKAIKENPGIFVWRRLSKKIWWNVSRLSGRHPITKPKCQKINLCNSPQVVVIVHLVSLHTIFTLDLS